MNRMRAFVAAAEIELHWAIIRWYRHRGGLLIERGEPLTSPHLLKYSRIIDHHGMRAFRLEKQFE